MASGDRKRRTRQAAPKTARRTNPPSAASATIVNGNPLLWGLIAAIVIVPLVVFLRVVSFGFVEWDDPEHITQNPLYQPTPFAHIGDLWAKPYFGDYLPLTRTVWAMLAGVSAAPNGQPVTTFDPSTYHAANLCLHIANVLLVFFILRFFVKKDWAAALGALLFAVHPLQVEPVAWVSGLRDLLCAFFSFACLLLYLVAIRGEASDPKGRWWLVGASACYILALLSKSSAAVLPFLCLFLDTLMSGRVPRRRLVMLALWLLPAIGIGLMTKFAEIEAGNPPPPPQPFWQRPFVAGDTIGFYLWKLFIPHPLGVDYGRTPTWVMQHAWAYLPILVPIGLVVLAWRFWKRAPWLAIAIGIFLISLAPVSGIVPFAFQYYSTVADRYAYFAMLAPALAFAGILSLVPWRAAAAAGAVILFCLGWLAVRQIPVWAGTTALFTQALKANPDSFVSYSFLGGDLDEAGNFDQAIADYRKGIALNPKNWILQSGLGQALFQKWVIDGSRPQEIGLLQEAEQHFLATLAINGGYWQAHQNLGKIYDRMGRYKEALTQFQAAAKDAPNDPENNYMLALAYSRLGDMTDAEPLMQRAAAMGYAPAVQALAPQAPP